jgi:hypothetical protein
MTNRKKSHQAQTNEWVLDYFWAGRMLSSALAPTVMWRLSKGRGGHLLHLGQWAAVCATHGRQLGMRLLASVSTMSQLVNAMPLVIVGRLEAALQHWDDLRQHALAQIAHQSTKGARRHLPLVVSRAR